VLLTLAATASADDILRDNSTNRAIPDNGGWVASIITISSLPAGATIVAIDVSYAVVHSYSQDLLLHLNVDAQGNEGDVHLLTHEGGSNDNPSDIVSGITFFNGLSANRSFFLYARDTVALDSGYIDNWSIRVYYVTPDGATGVIEVSPASPLATGSPQDFIIRCENVLPNYATVDLRDRGDNDREYLNRTVYTRSGDEIMIRPNFGNDSGYWDVRVNVGAAVGEWFAFHVSTDVPCTFTLASYTANVGAGAASRTVGITAGNGCAWLATASAPWLHTTSSGTGDGTVALTVDANPNSIVRTGSISAGGRTFTIAQAAAACSYLITPSQASRTAAASTGSFSVTTGGTCTRNATSNVPWFEITSSHSGTGSWILHYAVEANPTSNARTGIINVRGRTFTLAQAGSASNASPTIGSLSGPSAIDPSASLLLVANNVGDVDGTVAEVRFYHDSDGSGTWSEQDVVLGNDTNAAGGWRKSITRSFLTGANTFFARVRDNRDAWSMPRACVVQVGAEVLRARSDYLGVLRNPANYSDYAVGWANPAKYLRWPASNVAQLPDAIQVQGGRTQIAFGNRQCVAFVKKMTEETGSALSWQRAERVMVVLNGGEVVNPALRPGDIIATMDAPGGTYPHPPSLHGNNPHCAIVVNVIGARAIRVVDQNFARLPRSVGLYRGFVVEHGQIGFGGIRESDLSRYWLVRLTSARAAMTTTVCRADFDADGSATTLDVVCFLNEWFAGVESTDFDESGLPVNGADLNSFLSAWFAGCP